MSRKLTATVLVAMVLVMLGCGSSSAPAGTWLAAVATYPQGYQQTVLVGYDGQRVLADLAGDELAAAQMALAALGAPDPVKGVMALRIVTPDWRRRARSEWAVSGFVVLGARAVQWDADGMPVGAYWFGPAGERLTTAAVIRAGLGGQS